ncbi:Holliday junction DNA helicase RuvA [Entomoplasma ellychniae]|uniref:Holliday junction branch migration complex subunit RuvA n=1 Tax=Entomoplasma ellychniae TaxID=2114 RepID=A0A8E2QVJ0_9MOLU|nr:Holliday junction branch migration protein RuvA [Entomoplasma ellychniae]PPE04461.1 Holliday junction DNA helicase RuvA [Entomoplasma ellychniae]
MINYIKTKIQSIDEQYIYLDNKEYGYYFYYLLSDKLSELDQKQEYKFYISEFKNEFSDIQIVFKKLETRNLFNNLITIKTVGFKTTLLLLNNFTFEELYLITKECDVELLSSIRNIGIYTARLIIDQLQQYLFANKLNSKKEQVLISLTKLGYKQKDILKAINTIDNKLSIEQMISAIMELINE